MTCRDLASSGHAFPERGNRLALRAAGAAPRRRRAAPVRGATLPAERRRGGAGIIWLGWLGAVMARLREREELRALTPRERRDLGLSDYDAGMLARKPLWRA